MRLVLIRLSALGDIVHTWPLAVALREGLPDAHITWVVEEPLRPLVEGHPAIDSVITVATRRWRKTPFAALTRAETGSVRTILRELAPDVAIDPQGTVKSAWVTRWTGAPERIGLARPWRRELLAGMAYNRTTPGDENQRHVVATNIAMVKAIGLKTATELPLPDGSWLLNSISEHYADLSPADPYAVILPGAGHPSKVLNPRTLADVAVDLAKQKLKPVVAWGPGERERAAAVVSHSDGAADLAPKTSLEQLTVLLGQAAVVVGGDTGPVHLAASLGVPTLGVFLTTDWRRNGPLGRQTAVISSARLPRTGRPTGSAGAKPGRPPSAVEIWNHLRTLLAQSKHDCNAAEPISFTDDN
ncbi:MAG: lipopolysaccharide heptosyltransferase I [Thermoanaerobaculales bacterium]|nr:lipopolysaccharide heptosyltransferase I [Thermoanaerobaculales bacterium]